LVYYGGFVVGPKIQSGVRANAQGAAQAVYGGVQVQVFALDAEITGVVPSEDMREGVKRAVARVEGVRKVVDKMTVELVPSGKPINAAEVDALGAGIAVVPEAVDTDVVDGPGEADVTDEAEDVAALDDDVVDDDVTAADEEVGPDDVADEPLSMDAIEAAAAVPDAPAMLELKWNGLKLTMAGAGSKALVASLNELMLSDYVADDFVGEVATTEMAPPAGFDAGAKLLTQLLATAKSGSFRLEDKRLKVDVVVADAPAKAKFLRGLARVSGAYKREVNVAIEPEPAVVVEPATAEVAPTPPAATVKDPGGALSVVQCQALIDAALDGPEKQFKFTRSGSSRLAPEAATKVNEIAGFLKRCPAATGEIHGFHHNQGDPDEIRSLTRKRAYSVHAAIVAAGIDAKRFTYQGMGYNYPKYPNKIETRHLNERVEFKLGVD